MRNIKAVISYCGTAYHGFQRQENAVAVQNILEEKLSELTNSPVKINGCSRTDTGVHANEYCFSFLTEHVLMRFSIWILMLCFFRAACPARRYCAMMKGFVR